MAHGDGGDDVKLGDGGAGDGGGGGAAAATSGPDSIWGSTTADAAAALDGDKGVADKGVKLSDDKDDKGDKGGSDDAAAKAAAEAEAKAKTEADAKAKTEADAKTKAETEAKAKAEEERRGKLTKEERDAEDKAKAEADAKAKAEEDAKAKDDPVPEGDYDASKFTAPDGVEIDPEEIKALTPLLKEFGLGHARTQKLLDGLSSIVLKRAAAGEAQALESYAKLNTDWHTQCIADEEIGGSEEAHTKTLGVASIGLEKLGTPELRKFLKDSRAGNNPELIRFAARVGKLFLEDGADPTDPKARAAALKRGDATHAKAKTGPDAVWGKS